MANPLGSTPSIIAGVAVGGAATTAIEPALEIPRQEAWKRNPVRILPTELIARLIAQGGVPLDQARYDEANREGFSDDKLDALVYLSQTVPGFADGMRLWRLGLISDPLFAHTLVKAGLDARYTGPLSSLKVNERLGLGDLAYAVVRGIVPSPPWVPVAPPATGDKVPRFPQVAIDPAAYAAQLGFNEDHLKMMVGRSGLSMAPVMAANASFRGIIGPNDYLLAIAEGDLRTEWAEAVHEVSREILTASQYAELELRGFYTADVRRARTAQHGMSQRDSDDLYDVLGRAPGVHAITTGLARGATYPSDYSAIPEPYKSAIQRSNIRPEFAEIEYHDRYSYPSGFQIKAETQNGDLAQADAEQILLEVGWSPKWAAFFSDAWANPKAKASSSHVTKAQNQLWTATHKAYINRSLPATDAAFALTTAGVPQTQQADVLRIWGVERDLIRKELSVKQIVKAAASDPNYGTRTQKLDAITALGYSLAEAETLVDEG